MSQKTRFVLTLHNHQPIGNFDGVFEQAYQDSYRPFLNVFERYESLRIALHTSGSLIEWLDANHPEYLDRLATLVAAGRVEIVGGAFFEPILTMLPSRDRVGQIQSYTHWLEQRLGARIRGMWIPERVWEPALARDLADAGIEYTLLDDFHFRSAGLADEELYGYYLTEDDGRLLKVFPGSERLRYVIPFGAPEDTIDYLRHLGEVHPGAVAVFGDDGEKFGTWPETKKHVYENGWLVRFFDALAANADWLSTTTLADAVDNVPPTGKVYLPDCSYREMTEWVLPPDRLVDYERVSHEMESDPRWPVLKQFVRGGLWRNYKIRYPESDEMYSRMLAVSKRLAAAIEQYGETKLVQQARTELYRGQCNCSYWHGAFGGIYLPHLRNAVYQHLIAAENLLHQVAGRNEPWVEAVAEDFNLDARQEVLLANDKLVALLAPSQGGQLYELDVRSICHNLLATLARRPEAYHRKVLAGQQGDGEQIASIHQRVVFKQEGLDQRIQYDDYLRKSLLDHFYDNDISLEAVAGGHATERGDFLHGVYEARIRRSPHRVQADLVKEGNAWGLPLQIRKSVTIEAGSSTLEIHYQISGLPPDRPLHFAVEFNFAGLPAGADDRYFYNDQRQRLGQLGTRLDLADANGLGVADEWLGLGVGLACSRPTHIWAFPIESVSQSEGGFELVHQSVAIVPHWIVSPNSNGLWEATMNLAVDTSPAESRQEKAVVVAAS